MLAKKRHPPVAVLAAPDSGGSLLARALGGHGAIHGFDDAGLVGAVLALLDALAEDQPKIRAARAEQVLDGVRGGDIRDGRLALLEQLASGARKAPDRGATVSLARGLIGEFLSGLAADARKRVPAVHARDCAGRVRDIIGLFPDALIVHLVRDGRAVALVQAGAAARPGGLRHLARAWLEQIEPLLALEADEPGRVVKSTYEDLLVQPETELARVCAALGLAPEPERMTAAFLAALGDQDRFAFASGLLDGWQIVELETELQPVLALLGYRPAADLDLVARLRAQAEAFEALRAEADELRTRLAAIGRPEGAAAAQDKLYEDALDEVRQLRFRQGDQEYLSSEINTLRWKAKRYDQIRAAASPLLKIRRRRGGG